MKTSVSTASCSIAAFWLGVRMLDVPLGGVAGDVTEPRELVLRLS